MCEFMYEEFSEVINGFVFLVFIGEGGFGKVYRGVLRDGMEVVIKKFMMGGYQGDCEFLVEVEMLSWLYYCYLVKFLGYFCLCEFLVQLLCYEFIFNGSVDLWFYGFLGEMFGFLDWFMCMKIVIGFV